mmetsp:Transcript_13183/g.15091  ORF Transcript_13183/g.15091 Transcript_13183/m.15091 type:complete len:401 (+) Transcript_13183:124-1326(+)|eukprot:CAMPEP_0184017448 /NCGR_PEP_ID=MMETSP0954-20121128/7540_1 /TAXON_ID=627963 /ORGANISM="Aplanochytrium sp, Strain PBS07" /LENGTH=400 /DNA_ID=CAMNT_0026298681 /DNA_START=63 /DNA_END=1265 /DNA_ORIENTATION=+
MGQKNDWRDRLEAFYKHYQPEKLSGVPALLKKIDGNQSRFDRLLAQLVQKYGPEPEIKKEKTPKAEKPKGTSIKMNESLRNRITAFYLHYNKGKLDTVEDLVVRTKNKKKYEDRLMRMLVKKYGPEPQMEDSFRGRLTRFYLKYQPTKLDGVENFVLKAGGSETQQEQLFRMLVTKYGPEPEFSGIESKLEHLSLSEPQESGDMSDDDNDEMNPLFRKVVYCPIDGMPPEYSEYLTTFGDCLPWLLKNTPNLILTTKGDTTVAEYAASLENGEESTEASNIKGKSRGGAARPNKNIKNKKKTKDKDKKVTIERVSRSKRKFITVVVGLDMFDVKLKEAAKKLGKRFACSASINKLPSGGQSIDIQGDITYELPEVLLDYFPSVDKEKIYTVEDGKKNKVF